jgi:hypothetical protein
MVVPMTPPNHGARRTTAHLLYVVHIIYMGLYRKMSRGVPCAVVSGCSRGPHYAMGGVLVTHHPSAGGARAPGIASSNIFRRALSYMASLSAAAAHVFLSTNGRDPEFTGLIIGAGDA